MRFIRGLVGLTPVLLFVAVQQFTAQTAAKKGTAPAQKAAPAQTPAQTPVQRGKYLVTLGGCNDCHTPKTSAGATAPKRPPTCRTAPAQIVAGRRRGIPTCT